MNNTQRFLTLLSDVATGCYNYEENREATFKLAYNGVHYNVSVTNCWPLKNIDVVQLVMGTLLQDETHKGVTVKKEAYAKITYSSGFTIDAVVNSDDILAPISTAFTGLTFSVEWFSIYYPDGKELYFKNKTHLPSNTLLTERAAAGTIRTNGQEYYCVMPNRWDIIVYAVDKANGQPFNITFGNGAYLTYGY